MRCYKCLKQVPDRSEECPFCGQALVPSLKKDNKKEKPAPIAESPAPESHKEVSKPPQKSVPAEHKRSARADSKGEAKGEGKDFQMGDVIVDRYEVREVLRKSGLGTLYKVKDKKEKKIIALKMVSPDVLDPEGGLRHYLEGIKSIKALDNEHLIQIIDIAEVEGIPYYTMEFLEALTLKKLIAVRMMEKQVFSLEEAEPILLPVCEALTFLHRKKIVHTALKPENILILPDSLKLTEVSEAALVSPSEFISAHLSMGEPYYYLAPEFITSGGSAQPRGDVYSLGVILYQMVTGVIPKGSFEPPTKINSSLPSDLDGFLEKSLEQEPEKRHESIEAFKRGFLMVLGEAPPEAAEEEAGEAAEEAGADEEAAQEPEVGGAEPATEETPEETKESLVEEREEKEVEAGEQEAVPERGEGKPSEMEKEEPPPPSLGGEAPEKPEGFVTAREMTEAFAPQQREPEKPDSIPSVKEPPPPPSRGMPREIPSVDIPPRISDIHVPKREPLPSYAPGEYTPKKGMKTAMIAGAGILVLVLGVFGAYTMFSKGGKGSSVALKQKSTVRTTQEARQAAQDVKKEEARKIEEAKKAAEESRRVQEEAKRVQEEAKKAEEKKKKADEKKEIKVAAAKKPEVPPPSRCPDGMVDIPSGNFFIGSPANDSMRDFSEKQSEKTFLAEFCIDIYEYPNRKGAEPTRNVSWNEAKSKCEAEKKRLCTEEEWEKACKGGKNARFPYGDGWDAGKCNTQDSSGVKRNISASGSFPACRSGYGVLDASGNVREWTSSRFSATLEDRVVRGGSSASADWASRCAYRYNALPQSKDKETGFRCCK